MSEQVMCWVVSRFFSFSATIESVDFLQELFKGELDIVSTHNKEVVIYSTNNEVAAKLKKFMDENTPNLHPKMMDPKEL